MQIYNTDSTTVKGTDSSDIIINDAPEVLVEGYGGNDQINNVANGTFTACGGAGNDIIINFAESGDTSLDGQWGDDFIISYVTQSLDVLLIGGDGNDTLMNCGNGMATLDAGGYGNKIFVGGAGVDVFVADIDNNNTIFNYDANDLIYCGSFLGGGLVETSGTDVIIKDFDTYAATVVKGAAGKPLNVFYSEFDENFRWAVDNYNDMFTARFYSAQTVEDFYYTTIYGTAFDDAFDNTTEDAQVYGLGGNDTITNSASDAEIYGNTGNDVLINSVEEDYYGSELYGGRGEDVLINESAFNAQLYGDGGNDYIVNHASNYSEPDGRILLDGGDGSDTLTSYGFGIATLDGGSGNDILIGGAGVDIFYMSRGAGSDVILNCTSDDLIYFDGSLTECAFQVVGTDIVVLDIYGGSVQIQNGMLAGVNFFTNDNEHDFERVIENYQDMFAEYADTLIDDVAIDDTSIDDALTDIASAADIATEFNFTAVACQQV